MPTVRTIPDELLSYADCLHFLLSSSASKPSKTVTLPTWATRPARTLARPTSRISAERSILRRSRSVEEILLRRARPHLILAPALRAVLVGAPRLRRLLRVLPRQISSTSAMVLLLLLPVSLPRSSEPRVAALWSQRLFSKYSQPAGNSVAFRAAFLFRVSTCVQCLKRPVHK